MKGIKNRFLGFVNLIRNILQILIPESNNNEPCFECIKAGGICQPQCEKRYERKAGGL